MMLFIIVVIISYHIGDKYNLSVTKIRFNSMINKNDRILMISLVFKNE